MKFITDKLAGNVIKDINDHPLDTVSSSDQNSIIFEVDLKCQRLKSSKRRIYNMNKADFKLIHNELIMTINYDDINHSLEISENTFFKICDKFISKVTVKSSF